MTLVPPYLLTSDIAYIYLSQYWLMKALQKPRMETTVHYPKRSSSEGGRHSHGGTPLPDKDVNPEQ